MNSEERYHTIKNQIIAILDNNPKINYICLQEVDGRLKQILQVSILNVNDWEWRPGLQRTWNGMIDSEEDRNNNPEWDYAYTVTKKNQREYYNCSSPITIKSAHLKDNGYGNPVGKEPIEDALEDLDLPEGFKLEDFLKALDGVGQHEGGDYILFYTKDDDGNN